MDRMTEEMKAQLRALAAAVYAFECNENALHVIQW